MQVGRANGCRPKRSGRRRPGGIRTDPLFSFRGALHRFQARWRTWVRTLSARCRWGASRSPPARSAASRCSEMSGNGPPRISLPIRASPHFPTPNIQNRFSTTSTRCCGEAPGPPILASYEPVSATGISPPVDKSSPGFDAPGMRARNQPEKTTGKRDERCFPFHLPLSVNKYSTAGARFTGCTGAPDSISWWPIQGVARQEESRFCPGFPSCKCLRR